MPELRPAQCSPAGKLIGPVCRAPPRFWATSYLKIVQDVLFQANYYRDPLLTRGRRVPVRTRGWPTGTASPTRTRRRRANFLRTEKVRLGRGHQGHGSLPARRRALGRAGPGRPLEARAAHEAGSMVRVRRVRPADGGRPGQARLRVDAGQHIDFTDEELFGWLDKWLA